MAQVLEFKQTDQQIGLSVRTSIKGPESVLVNNFAEQYIGKLEKLKRYYALFYEPLLPTGYPDLVIVSYNCHEADLNCVTEPHNENKKSISYAVKNELFLINPQKYESWSKQRKELTVLDLKILHHLYFVKGSTSINLERQLGMDSKLLLRSLERLMDASMIKRTKQRWVPYRLSNNYGISSIKTIEAKISNWSSVFNQATLNLWFSSESSILSPVTKPSNKVISNAESKGIGIYSMPLRANSKISSIQKPLRTSGIPISYASWLFNEWIGRQLFRKGFCKARFKKSLAGTGVPDHNYRG